MTRRAHRYPLEPLLTRLGIEIVPDGTEGGDHTGDPPAGFTAAAITLGVTRRTVQRLALSGLSDRQADHYAISLGFHPAHIWSEWWEHAPGELDLPR